MDLTEKEKLFTHYYLGISAGNATDAARRAGYIGSYDYIRQVGSKLLTREHVRAAIDARMDDVAMTSAEILARLSTLARADMSDFLAMQGDVLKIDLKRAGRKGKMPVIRKIKRSGDRVEIELYNPFQALEKLGQYRGLWKDKLPTDTYAHADTDDSEGDIEPSPDQGPLPE